jgi:serine/threonine protein phosphatase PrpC
MGCASSSHKADADAQPSPSPSANDQIDEQDEYKPLTDEEVNARIVCSPKSELFKLGDSGISLRYAYLSQRGYYPEDLYKANQDAFKVVPKFNGNKEHIFFGVFDGHGVEGDSCSYFVRDNIEGELKRQIKNYPDDFEKAYKEAFVSVNQKMHEQEFDDSMSGTTAITAYFHGTQFTVANIGDSRAVVGEKKGKRVIAYSLSIDQTPYRQDERERVKASGAVVMSCDQLEGIVPYHENWGVNLGEELDNGGDPPRVWAPGKSFPGCAFTRSIGDSVAEGIGVTAEPELLRKELTEEDQFVVLASDGVWEFLTNQSVADMILKFSDPLDACRAVVAESYRLWLQYEVRTDDITMILAFIDTSSDLDEAERESLSLRRRRESRRGSADQISVGLDIVGRAGGENRPVRRGLSKEKKQQMAIAMSTSTEDEDTTEWVMEVVPKKPEELDRIKTAVKANFLFQHLNDDQAKQVYDVMKRVAVKKGDVVIRQGDQGDWFYVVDEGEYVVTLSQNGK